LKIGLILVSYCGSGIPKVVRAQNNFRKATRELPLVFQKLCGKIYLKNTANFP
jgi:hypothetical protein